MYARIWRKGDAGRTKLPHPMEDALWSILLEAIRRRCDLATWANFESSSGNTVVIIGFKTVLKLQEKCYCMQTA